MKMTGGDWWWGERQLDLFLQDTCTADLSFINLPIILWVPNLHGGQGNEMAQEAMELTSDQTYIKQFVLGCSTSDSSEIYLKEAV